MQFSKVLLHELSELIAPFVATTIIKPNSNIEPGEFLKQQLTLESTVIWFIIKAL